MLAKKSDNRSTENTNGKSAQKPKKKKTRTTFTAYQLEELERAFERAPYPGNNKIKAFLGLIHLIFINIQIVIYVKCYITTNDTF